MFRLFKVVATCIQAVLDVIAPRHERVMRAESYTLEDLMIAPKQEEIRDCSITTLLSYKDTATEDCIRSLKYNRSDHAAALLAEILEDYLREEISSIRAFSTKHICLVPLPLHAARAAERGFNQVSVVLQKLPREFHEGTLARINEDALVRIRETKPQTRLSREDRLKNVKGAFAILQLDAVLDAHVSVIDDVMTTGATLSEAARPLMNLNIPVSLTALARA